MHSILVAQLTIFNDDHKTGKFNWCKKKDFCANGIKNNTEGNLGIPYHYA